MTLLKVSYEILDVAVSLETESEPFLELFDRDYCWFKAPGVHSRSGITVHVSLGEGRREALLRIGGEAISLEGHPNPGLYAYQLILKRLFQEIKGFLLLHAGVVARNDQALILAGPPGAGKSTMVSKLIEWGMVYFSDDFCPFHTESRFIHPFPRSLWISPQSKLAGSLPLNRSVGSLRNNKIPIRPGELPAVVGRKPCKPGWLICLDPGEDPGKPCELRLGLKNQGGEDLLADLSRLQDVVLESPDSSHLEWRVTYPVGRGLTTRIKELLEKHEHAIWNVFRVDRIRPQFDRDPSITPISTSQAAFQLMRELKQGLEPESAGTKPIRSSPGRLLMTLNELLMDVSCYRLTVGKLEAMTELVLRTTG